MTGPRSASPLTAPAADWTGADIRGLHDLAATLYGYHPEITGVLTTLDQEVARLTGGDQGWRGPVASSFAAAWQRDVAAVETLAQVVAWTADVVDDLAVELAAIETSLAEAAPATAGYRQACDRALAAARRASEQAALRLTDVLAVFTAGPEPVLRQVVGDPAGSIAGVTATEVAQAGLGDRAADSRETVAGGDHPAAHLWDSLL